MKKAWKGLVGAVSAAAIAATGFIGATSAFAEDVKDPASGTTTITIGSEDNKVVAGDAYSAYRILDVTNSGANNQNYAYTVNEKYAAILEEKFPDIVDWDTATSQEINRAVYTAINNNASSMQILGDAIYDLIAAAKPEIAPDATATAAAGTSGVETFKDAAGKTNLPQGYYLIKQTANGNDAKDYSAIIVDTAGNDTLAVNPKSDTVTMVKKVVDWNETEDTDLPDASDQSSWTDVTWQDSADHKIGEDIPYKLEGSVPSSINNYDTFVYKFTDTFSAGLDYNNDAKVYLRSNADAELQEITSGFTTTYNDETRTLTVGTTDLKTVKIGENNISFDFENDAPIIVVLYTAKLNDDAVLGNQTGEGEETQGNPNTAYLEFSNKPGQESLGQTTEDVVTVFTYDVTVNKEFKNGNATAATPSDLPQFELSKQINGEWESVEVLSIDADTLQVKFNGIDDGFYKLEEVYVPAGFNKVDNIYFTVEATHDGTNDNPKLTKFKITVTDADGNAIEGADNVTNGIENGDADGTIGTGNTVTGAVTTVVNNAGSELPSTGGMGTVVLYAAGAAIVLIAGLGLAFALRRRQA